MTYNFDPDRWYENELAYLSAKFKSGAMSLSEYERAKTDLDGKYDEMIDRLDGSYQIPNSDEP